MNIDKLKSKIKRINNKWYFKIPIIGRKLKESSKDERVENSIDATKNWIVKHFKEEFNNKSKEEQFEIIERVIDGVVDDMGIYTKPNWKKICSEVRSELYEHKYKSYKR